MTEPGQLEPARLASVRRAIAHAVGLNGNPLAGCVAVDTNTLDRAALAAVRADTAWRAAAEHGEGVTA